MTSNNPTIPDLKVALDAFPLPPSNALPPTSTSIQPTLPPSISEKYQDKALPPIPPPFETPFWGMRSSPLVRSPLSAKTSSSSTTRAMKSRRSFTDLPLSPKQNFSHLEGPRRKCRTSAVAQDYTFMAMNDSQDKENFSQPNNSREAHMTSRPNSSLSTKPPSLEKDGKRISPITTSVPLLNPSTVSLRPSGSLRKILSLTGSNPVYNHSSSLFSPTGHNPTAKIKRLLGADAELSGSLPISPISTIGSFMRPDPVSDQSSDSDDDAILAHTFLNTRPDHEAWMGPSPSLPPLEIGSCLDIHADSFDIEMKPERRPAIKFSEPHSVRDLYHFSVLQPSQTDKERKNIEMEGNMDEIKIKPAQYSFFPRQESFSARRRNNALRGNGKLPPSPLKSKPSFVLGKHPIQTPFPSGDLATINSASSIMELSPIAPSTSTSFSPVGIVEPLLSISLKGKPEGEMENHTQQPVSAFEFDGEKSSRCLRIKFRCENRLSAFSQKVFKRHSDQTASSSEDKRLSKDSFFSISSNHSGLHQVKPLRQLAISTSPTGRAIIPVISTMETSDRSSSFASSESTGWFNHFGGASTVNTTPVSRLSNPSSSPGGDRAETEFGDNDEHSFTTNTKGVIFESADSSGNKTSRFHFSSSFRLPRRISAGSDRRKREKIIEQRRSSLKNKIRIIPEGSIESAISESVLVGLETIDLESSFERKEEHSYDPSTAQSWL